jgi:multidrug efflux pump subunit AcrB
MAGIFRTGTGLSDNLLQLEKEVSQKLNAAGLTLEKMPTEDQIVILADQEALLHYKVSIDQLYNTLKRHISELELLELKTIGSTTPLVISAQQNQTIEEIVQKLHIQNEEDQSIPIRSLVKTQYKQDAKEILSNQEGPYLPILLPKENAVKRTIEVLFALDKANSNYKILTWGPYFENQQLLKELLKVLLASVLLLYFIMAAQFESLIQPLIVLVEIPISLSGSVLLLSLTNSSLNMMAMIGMVVTVGIIINDSIIKIDTINRLRKQGLDTKQAIYKAGSKRLNPILMTSFTTIFAVLPSFLFQDVGAILQQPLALTLIGGMLIGTMVSLYLIPLLYSFGYRKN